MVPWDIMIEKGQFIGKPKKLIKTPKIVEEPSYTKSIQTSKSREKISGSGKSTSEANVEVLQLQQPNKNITESYAIEKVSATESNPSTVIIPIPNISRTSDINAEKDKNRNSILISALELQKAHEIVSLLRHDHGFNVVASRSGIDVGASYMMSSRCALIRIVTEEFCNASNR